MWILALVAIAGIVLEIIIIVKFFQLCGDVRKIESKVECSHGQPVSVRDVKKAVVMGTTDEAYQKIVSGLYDSIAKYPHSATVPNQIAYAAKLCEIMGKELPAQLKSKDAVEAFFKLESSGVKAEIEVGDTVFRLSDGKALLITASNGTSYNCVDPVTNAYVGLYQDKDLAKEL